MKKKAFSLIELLISLITISVILASLAPIVTHKLKHGGISIAQGESVTNQCTSFGANCQLCTKKKCLLCLVTCPDGQYADKDTCSCKNCIANCNSCINNTSCNRCKAGYQKSGNSCSACGAGYYSTEGGSCQKCAKGTKANASSAATGCTACTGNQYQDSEGQTTCKTCNPGFVSDSNRACSTCAAGKYWNGVSCQNCAAGSYSSSANVTSCTQCSTGTYQPSAGQTSCLSCNGANQYQDSTGQTSCKTCGANSAPNSSHTKCDAVAVACPSACKTCVSGTTNCASCNDGKYLDGTTCASCPTGCKKCTGANSCQECNNTTDYKLVSGECKAYKYPTSQADCDRLSNSKSVYIPLDVDKYDKTTLSSTGGTHGFCMAKRNAGDLDGPDISSAVKEIKAGTSTACDYANKEKCCWIGHSGKSDKNRTAKANTTDDAGNVTARYCTNNIASVDVLQETVDKKTTKLVSPFNYEACNRTVCNWWAADYICSNYAPSGGTSKVGDWGLPSNEAFTALQAAIYAGPQSKTDTSAKIYIQRWSGANGLQLCMWGFAHNTSGAPRCDFSSRCKGADTLSGDHCNLSDLWGAKINESKAYEMDTNGTKFGIFPSENPYLGEAFSVRCALEKYVE